MTTRGKIQYDITANTARFTTAMNQVNNNLTGMTKTLKNMGGILGGVFAAGQITSFIGETVRLFEIQEKSEAKLRTALGGNIDAFNKLTQQARTLQGLTLFGDEATIDAMAQLAALNLNADAIEKLIPLVQDFATLQGTGLSDAAKLVAKSVGSSTNALSRYGIVIEGAVGSAERLESAMTALQEMAGGQAMSVALDTQTGKITQLKNQWSDFLELIGKAATSGGFAILDVLSRGGTSRAAEAREAQLMRARGGFEGPVDPNQTIIGVWVKATEALNDELDDLDRRMDSPNLRAIFSPEKLKIQGIRPTFIEGVTDSLPYNEIKASLDKEEMREVTDVSFDLAQALSEIRMEMEEIPDRTVDWQSGLYGVQGILGGINAALALAGERTSGLAKGLLFLTTISQIVSSLTGGVGAISGLLGFFGRGKGPENFLKLRGPDIVGAVDTTRRTAFNLGAIGG